MAIGSQGTLLRRASTVTVDSSASTAMDIQSTVIVCTGVIDFTTAGLGFTTSMLIKCNAKDTAIYAVKSVAATAIAIYGTFGTTGATDIIVTGYSMGNIGEVTDFSGPSGSSPAIDITHLGTTDAHQKIMGLVDEGQLSMTLNYNATDTGQVGLRADRLARTKNLYDILFADTTKTDSSIPSRAAMFAICSQFNPSGALDNKVSANCVLEISGAVQYTTIITT